MKTMEKGQSTFAILCDEYNDYGKNQDHYERQERMLNQAYQNGFDAAEDQFKPKWISVEEGLPGYNQRVLAFTPDTDNTREDTRIIIYGSIPSGFPSGVTHWMPLPTKP